MHEIEPGGRRAVPRDQASIRTGLIAFLEQGVTANAAAMLGLLVAHVGLEFLSGLVLARLLGASNYGTYAFALSWVGLLGIPSAVGFDRLLIREIVSYRVRAEWPAMHGILRRSNQIALTLSICLAVVVAISAAWFVKDRAAEMVIALQVGMVIVPILAIARLRQATLQGLGHLALGQLPETFVQPLILLGLMAGLIFLPDFPRTGPVAVALNAIAAAVACLFGIWLLRRRLPTELVAAEPEYRTRIWLRTALPFVWILGMNVIMLNTDVILLGMISGSESAGIYRISNQLASFIAFPLTAMNMAFAPTIAAFYARNDRASLQRNATQAARAILVIAFPVAALLVTFGKSILHIFGAEFVAGYIPLLVLSGSFFVNAALGTSGYLLIMTKHETIGALAYGACAAINLAGNLLLIPLWGINGAAIATGTSIIAVSVAFAVLAHRKLAVNPTAFRAGWR